MEHIISITVENKFGVLSRVAGLFSGRGFNIDVRMDQTPQAWIAAAGYAPISLLRPTPAEIHGSAVPAVQAFLAGELRGN